MYISFAFSIIFDPISSFAILTHPPLKFLEEKKSLLAHFICGCTT